MGVEGWSCLAGRVIGSASRRGVITDGPDEGNQLMEQTFRADEITVGFHPDGYRIDKTTEPLNWYTKLETDAEHPWRHPKPVPFDALPQEGWICIDRFDWDRSLCCADRLFD